MTEKNLVLDLVFSLRMSEIKLVPSPSEQYGLCAHGWDRVPAFRRTITIIVMQLLKDNLGFGSCDQLKKTTLTI